MDDPEEPEGGGEEAAGVVEKKEAGVGVLSAVVVLVVGRVAVARWEEGPARPRAVRRAWRFIVFGGVVFVGSL